LGRDRADRELEAEEEPDTCTMVWTHGDKLVLMVEKPVDSSADWAEQVWRLLEVCWRWRFWRFCKGNWRIYLL